MTRALDDRFGFASPPDTQSIGPTFGAAVASNAGIAIVVSLLLISVYLGVRFGWKYPVPVLIATVHDNLVVSGVYALTDREVTTATVAALLTILGTPVLAHWKEREAVYRRHRAAVERARVRAGLHRRGPAQEPRVAQQRRAWSAASGRHRIRASAGDRRTGTRPHGGDAPGTRG